MFGVIGQFDDAVSSAAFMMATNSGLKLAGGTLVITGSRRELAV
jgi:hypothetical protein